MTKRTSLILAALYLVAGSSYSHTGFHSPSSFFTGILHPLTGLDHLLAMLSMGIISGQMNIKSRFFYLASLFASLLAGGFLGNFISQQNSFEFALISSLLFLGIFLVKFQSFAFSLLIGLSSVFAFIHGLTHGQEAPSNVSALAFGGGFILCNVAMQFIGLALSKSTHKFKGRNRQKIRQAWGLGVLSTGLFLLASFILTQ